ncbi:LysR family transcriptional regulator [Providencia vermicola]|uniref:LysR family transcriptional regulator n=2 Tax=Providencia TaxID=586 RepID=A0AAX3S200_9GAMM|nr:MULTISPECIES: LysR family transcriptional regulator [Providencia]ELX8378420.1 LysR family transcriptional regulator [Providencia stuartii]EMD5257627.1 LysR family transcriptional regulator [Providencia stuartii]USB35565.1 LysR family transcriptional regulator [Providencia vermicola]WFC08071.1 LysR family transcriptional regulator [Providencia vermicola]
MMKGKMNDLHAFLIVAQEQSFTKAAARLGVTPSALSHTIRLLEERLGIRLLARTTRNVSVTEAGAQLMNAIRPLFEQIDIELNALSELRDSPRGTIRLSCTDDQIEIYIRPILNNFLQKYPDITIEIYVDYGFTNIVEERFDAGIRIGDDINKDMIAVRIGPDWRLIAVASPDYFKQHPKPLLPKDLSKHQCINIRHRAAGAIYAWEFKQDGHTTSIKVDGQLVFNSTLHQLNAALDGMGIAYIPEHLAEPYITKGKLQAVLIDYSPCFEGFHLYYPNRRQSSPAFMAFVEAIRYRFKEHHK